MKYSSFILVLFALLFGACQKETALNGMLEEVENTATDERAPDCTAKLRLAGFTSKNISGKITIRHYEAGFLMSEQTYEFKPPLCTTCTIDIPVTYATRLEITGQTFSGIDPFPAGRFLFGLKRPGLAKEKAIALKGNGSMLVLENFTCTDL